MDCWESASLLTRRPELAIPMNMHVVWYQMIRVHHSVVTFGMMTCPVAEIATHILDKTLASHAL